MGRGPLPLVVCSVRDQCGVVLRSAVVLAAVAASMLFAGCVSVSVAPAEAPQTRSEGYAAAQVDIEEDAVTCYEPRGTELPSKDYEEFVRLIMDDGLDRDAAEGYASAVIEHCGYVTQAEAPAPDTNDAQAWQELARQGMATWSQDDIDAMCAALRTDPEQWEATLQQYVEEQLRDYLGEASSEGDAASDQTKAFVDAFRAVAEEECPS